MNTFPWFILEEISKHLDKHTLVQFRLACREFNQIAEPLLFRVHLLRSTETIGYHEFLKKKGKSIEVLKLESFDGLELLYLSGLSLSTLFPNLSSLSSSLNFKTKETCIERLADDCLKLRKLRYLSLIGYQLSSSVFNFFKPVIRRLDLLHVEAPREILENAQDFKGLKTFLFGYKNLDRNKPLVLQTAKIFEVVLLDNKIPFISSNPSSTLSCSWVRYCSNVMECLVKLSPKYSKNKSALQRICSENTSYPEGFYVAETHSDLLELVARPGLVEHCTVRRYPTSSEECSLAEFKSVPSLEVVIYHFPSYQFAKEKFQATKLSLEMIYGWTISCFRWTIECFPNLQHLYIENRIADELVFLKRNSFPKLVHFYSSVKQTDYFWSELIKAAPLLLYIHTDFVPSSRIQKLRPFLQFVPYRNIMGYGGGSDEISGYNGCLYDR